MEAAVSPAPRDYRPWTDADSAQLRELSGRSYSEAARRLGREKSTIRKAARRLGIPMGRSPPPAYEVTTAEVLAVLDAGPASTSGIAERYGANPARVNGLLGALLREGRVVQTFGRRWAKTDEQLAEKAPRSPATRLEAGTYAPTAEDLAVRRVLATPGQPELCGGCDHYDGPLVRPPGGQLRGRCLVLALDVVPGNPDHPCGKSFTPVTRLT